LGILAADRLLALPALLDHFGRNHGGLLDRLGRGRFSRLRLPALGARTPFTAFAPAAALLAAAALRTLVVAFAGDHRRQVAVVPFDLLANQLLDGVDVPAVGLRRDGEGLAGAPGATGAADAVDVILGVDRRVVVEDVADVGD